MLILLSKFQSTLILRHTDFQGLKVNQQRPPPMQGLKCITTTIPIYEIDFFLESLNNSYC
jgi:hypothetical protein